MYRESDKNIFFKSNFEEIELKSEKIKIPRNFFAKTAKSIKPGNLSFSV